MRLTSPAVALLVAAATGWAGTTVAAGGTAVVPWAVAEASAEATAAGFPADVATAWETAPVYVDETQDGLVPAEDEARLTDRVEGHSPATYLAVLPATALSDQPGDTNEARATAFLDAVADAGPDGVYLVVFGGAGTYGAAYGVDADVAHAVQTAVDQHTRSQQVAILDDALTGLGVPGAPEEPGGTGWVLPIVIVLVVLALGAGALVWWRRKRAAGDGGTGQATYRPSFDVLDDEADSLGERQQLAREDVTRFGEELDAADLDVTDPAVAADTQAAMDAYAEAGGAVDGAPDDHVLRAVRSTVEYGRWRLACAQARLAGRPLPARRADCFFDQRHGVSVTDWMYTPPGGRSREVPVCAACRDRLSGAAR